MCSRSKPLQRFQTLQAVCRTLAAVCRTLAAVCRKQKAESSKPLAGFKTTARVLDTVITYRLVVSFLLPVTNALFNQSLNFLEAGFRENSFFYIKTSTTSLRGTTNHYQ
jgi:hypothetical protein